MAKGESEIKATCKGGKLGKMKAKTYTKKSKTVAVRLVHEKNYNSTDLSDADIKAILKKVYKQAVLEFTVTRLPAKTVEFDKSGDGKLDTTTWMTDEMKKVRDECKDNSYDFNIFLVDNGSHPTGTGFMGLNQRYGFVHVNQSTAAKRTLAHEVGHGLGLSHPNSAPKNPHPSTADSENIMYRYSSATKWRLRKYQWDKLNP